MIKPSNSRGFTLLELLLVISITGVIAVTMLVNYSSSQDRFAVERSVQTLVGALREAQNDALGAKQIAGSPPGTFNGGYGIYTKANAGIVLFADLNGNFYGSAAESQKTVLLEGGVSVSAVSPESGLTGQLHILFLPPDPVVYFNGSIAGVTNTATITLRSQGGITKTVRLNSLGAINVE